MRTTVPPAVDSDVDPDTRRALREIGETLERDGEVLASADIRPQGSDGPACLRQMRTRQLFCGFKISRDGGRQGGTHALRRLELHQDGREPLRRLG